MNKITNNNMMFQEVLSTKEILFFIKDIRLNTLKTQKEKQSLIEDMLLKTYKYNYSITNEVNFKEVAKELLISDNQILIEKDILNEDFDNKIQQLFDFIMETNDLKIEFTKITKLIKPSLKIKRLNVNKETIREEQKYSKKDESIMTEDIKLFLNSNLEKLKVSFQVTPEMVEILAYYLMVEYKFQHEKTKITNKSNTKV